MRTCGYFSDDPARAFIFDLILQLRRDGDLRGVLELEHYFHPLEQRLRDLLAQQRRAGRSDQ
jgi:hypothetical protein